MKNLTKISIAVVFIGLFTSCLKDDKYALDPSGGHNVVEFLNVTAPSSGYNDKYLIYNPVTLEAVEEQTVTLGINYAGPENVAPQDIVVQLEPAPEAITDNNDLDDTDYVQLASSLYDMPTSVTIPAGQRSVLFEVTVRPLQFDVDLSNALALKITSTTLGEISGNGGVAIFSLPVKNIWDGIYTIEEGSYVQRYSGPGSPTTGDALNGSLAGNPDITLTTMSSTSVEIGNMTWAGGTSGVAGIDNTRITIDPVTNQVTMSSLGNATLRNSLGKVNEYDPDTETFTLNFDWGQTTAPREMTLILKYSGPR